jgi:hypothetical protein
LTKKSHSVSRKKHRRGEKEEKGEELHGCALVFEMHHPYEMADFALPLFLSRSLFLLASPASGLLSSAPSNSCIGDVTPGSFRSAGKINWTRRNGPAD